MFESDITVAGTMAGTATSDTQQIAHGLRHRDIVLLHSLVTQYQYRLVRYLIYFLGRRDPVDDLVQETWLRVLERGRSYDGRSRFEPWLFTIARNLAIDHMRKHHAVSLDSSDNPEDNPDHHTEQRTPASNALSPFEQAARSEDARQLAQALQSLEPVSREALLLRFQEDLSLEEIAGIAGTSVSTVASRIYRGLAALRAIMTTKGEGHAR